jgi:hypothetical protein
VFQTVYGPAIPKVYGRNAIVAVEIDGIEP